MSRSSPLQIIALVLLLAACDSGPRMTRLEQIERDKGACERLGGTYTHGDWIPCRKDGKPL